MSITGHFKRLIRPSLKRIISRAEKNGSKRFLVAWNRGMGDIALGLYAFVDRVRCRIPDASITFLTRYDIEEVFQLLEGADVLIAPDWKRGDGIPDTRAVKKKLQSMGIDYRQYDVILDSVDPTGELKDCWGRLTPRLKWKTEYDILWKRFDTLAPSRRFIAVHVDTETQRFYGYRKDWPSEYWNLLFNKICENRDTNIILFGFDKKDAYHQRGIIDLRGKTSVMEMLSIIKNCCKMLIAPDGGVLSITYYLDVFFPIKVISLWADENQGVLKQAVPSPNKGLIHIPIIGKGKDISNIGVDEVFSNIIDEDAAQ